MPLESAAKLMADARRRGYAVGYFESWNLESLQGVLDAAEASGSPIIIGFNGAFLSRPDRTSEERLAWYAELGKAAARSAKVPCALIFNECPDDRWVCSAIDCGFNLVMLSDNQAPVEAYLRRVQLIVKHAHERHAAVEAELNELPCGASGHIEGDTILTDPILAERFVRDSGIDMLAVSVGNIHIATTRAWALNLDHLAALRDRIEVPMVLHGGSGIPADSLKAAVKLGVLKVNYGTCLKQEYLGAVRVALSRTLINPHELLGMGGTDDVMVAGRFAVRDAVLERIEELGCAGMAS